MKILNRLPKLKFIEVMPLYDLLLLYFGIVGISNVTLLALTWFKPILSLVIGVVVLGLFLLVFRPHIVIRDIRFGWPVLALLLLALVFRVPPWLYLMGGQDQGTYVNMSKQYELRGSLYAVDHFRETLTEEQKKIYDEHGNYMMPSFEKWNRPGSEYTMKFYPMHPSFMSIFGTVFGSDNRVYSLTFFSVITMVNIFLIVLLLSKSKGAGLLALGLIALNPLHVFFSKMPVGEITALAFSSSGFYFLLRFFDEFNEDLNEFGGWRRVWELVVSKPAFLYLSAFMFFGFMFVRMTFFVYVILLILLIFGYILLNPGKTIKIYLISYLTGLTILLGMSYKYYYLFLRPLYDLMYSSIVSRILLRISSIANIPRVYLLPLLITLIVTIFLSIRFKLYCAYDKYKMLTVYLVLFGIIVLLIDTFEYNTNLYTRLAYTGIESYERWNISQKGLSSIKNISLFAIVNHISIFGILAYLSYFIFILKEKRVNMRVFSVFFVFSYFFVLYGTSMKFMRYDYYNSRYYLTEVVPVFIIFASVYLLSILKAKWKYINLAGYLLIVLISLYYLFFSLILMKGPEKADNKFYRFIQNQSENNSIFVMINHSEESVYSENFNAYTFAPLKYYYEKNTLLIDNENTLEDPNILALLGKFDHVYVISSDSLIDSERFIVTGKKNNNLVFNHYNNGVGCGYHNYEFLSVKSVDEARLPGLIRCITLPNAYFTRLRDYNLYEITLL